MKKGLLLVLALLFTNLIYSQIKKVEVNDEEINVLGRITYGSTLKNMFTEEEIDKYNIKNTLAYLLEYTYEDKIIHRDILNITHLVLSREVKTRVNINSYPCFELSSIPQDVGFSLIKTNKWGVRNNEEKEYICYKPIGMFNNGIHILSSEDYKTYNLIDLADGKIKLKIYRLIEE